MEKIAFAFTLTLLISCTSIKNIDKLEEINKSTIISGKLNPSCPDDGICTIEIIKNRSLIIKKDEINSIYYQTESNSEYSIIKYSYTKNTEKEIQDTNYVEEIIFQINNSNSNLALTDTELQNTKMLFGRHCFCKGQAGYYLVSKGNLNFNKENEKYNLALDFIVLEVPQIINTIKVSFK